MFVSQSTKYNDLDLREMLRERAALNRDGLVEKAIELDVQIERMRAETKRARDRQRHVALTAQKAAIRDEAAHKERTLAAQQAQERDAMVRKGERAVADLKAMNDAEAKRFVVEKVSQATDARGSGNGKGGGKGNSRGGGGGGGDGGGGDDGADGVKGGAAAGADDKRPPYLQRAQGFKLRAHTTDPEVCARTIANRAERSERYAESGLNFPRRPSLHQEKRTRSHASLSSEQSTREFLLYTITLASAHDKSQATVPCCCHPRLAHSLAATAAASLARVAGRAPAEARAAPQAQEALRRGGGGRARGQDARPQGHDALVRRRAACRARQAARKSRLAGALCSLPISSRAGWLLWFVNAPRPPVRRMAPAVAFWLLFCG